MTDRQPTEADRRIAAHWLQVLVSRAGFPDQEALTSHLRDANISSCCACGCNTFNLAVAEGVKPLVAAGAYRMIFEADFREVGSDRTLDILLFANELGHASCVEVDYCVNSYPVPEHLQIEDVPFYTFIHPSLAVPA